MAHQAVDLTSIIICTFNRSSLLERLLSTLSTHSLNSQQFEVIVVNDGSWDDTALVCEQYARALPNFQTVHSVTNEGLAHARNLGIAAAKGKKILFTDDDCIPDPRWAVEMVTTLSSHPIVAGAVASPWASYLKLAHNIAHFYRFMPYVSCGTAQFLAGANMGFNREIFEKISDFDESLQYSEDMEMGLRARKAGYQIFFAPNARVQHDPQRRSLFEVLSYAGKHAGSTILLRQRYKSVLSTPWIMNTPVLLLLASPVIATKVTIDIFNSGPKTLRFLSTTPIVFATKLAWCIGAAYTLFKRGKLYYWISAMKPDRVGLVSRWAKKR